MPQLHGNERIGPQAVTELAIFLLEGFQREISDTSPTATTWFRRMLRTRSLYIMPTANAKGYYDGGSWHAAN